MLDYQDLHLKYVMGKNLSAEEFYHLEKWYEEKITKAMIDQDISTYEGIAEEGTCRDIAVELIKKILITIPVKSKDRYDVDEVTKRVLRYIKDALKYEVDQVAHCGHGK